MAGLDRLVVTQSRRGTRGRLARGAREEPVVADAVGVSPSDGVAALAPPVPSLPNRFPE
jgi:hypothetical protein